MDYNDEVSIANWVLIKFLVGIPILGFIYLIVLACGEHYDKKMYARAALVCRLIVLFISTIWVAILLIPYLMQSGM